MHFRRVLVLAVTLLATMGVTFTLAAVPAQAEAKQRHNVSQRAGEIRNSGVFQAYGRAYTAPNRIIYLQKRNRGGRWFNFKQTRAGDSGRFVIKFTGPRGSCYRVFIPASPRYYAYAANVGCIVAG